MVPDVGSASPARQLKNVLLPAPLGPIRPMISPSATSRSAPSTALNGAERLDDVARFKKHGAPSVVGQRLPRTRRPRRAGTEPPTG